MISNNSYTLIFNFISYLIIGASGVLINILIIKFFGVENLGLFNQIYAFFIILSQVGVGGIHLSILRFIPVYRGNDSEQKKILISAIISTISINILLLSLFYFSIPVILSVYAKNDLSFGLYSIIPAILFMSLNKIYLAYINGINEMKTFAFFQSLRFVLMLATLLTMVFLKVEGSYISTIFSFSESLLFVIIVITLRKKIAIKSFKFKVYKKWVRKHLKFGRDAVLGHIVTDLNTRVDVLVLGLFCSNRLIGIYTFAATLAEGFQQLPIVLRNFYNARIVHFLVKENDTLFTKILRLIKRKSYLIVLPIGLLGIAMYPILLMVIDVDIPLNSSWIVFSILTVGIMIAGGYIPIQFLMNHAGLPLRQTQLLLALFAINLILNFILIPFVGITGAAIATALATISLVPLLKVFSKKFLHINV